MDLYEQTNLEKEREATAEGLRAIYNLAAEIMDECATIMVASGAAECDAARASTPKYWQEWGEN